MRVGGGGGQEKTQAGFGKSQRASSKQPHKKSRKCQTQRESKGWSDE